ncbi:GAF domain-containing sensor histidine kinase [Ktedonosporobacter rubrisoli]|nr:GAF domain-containing sensor histidine kinase [Ktedonosporobacter rubrisoli]
MKTATTDRLTTAYLQKLSRYNFFATALAVLIITTSLFWMLFCLGGRETTVTGVNVIYVLTLLLSTIWACQTAYRARFGPLQQPGRYQIAWLLISIGFFFQWVGGFLYAYQASEVPVPSLSDLFLVLAYPITFIGILLLPTALRFRTRMGLDALITGLCILGIVWFFIIGPAYFQYVHQPLSFLALLKLAIDLFYPCGDLVLLLTILLLIQRGVEPAILFSLLVFGLGSLVSTWADAAYAYTAILLNVYHEGTISIDLFWQIGYLLSGLTGLYQYNALARSAYRNKLHQQDINPGLHGTEVISHVLAQARIWQYFQSLFVYIPLTLMLILVAYGEAMHDNATSSCLAVLSALIGILVAIRYFLTNRENSMLVSEREQRRQETERLRSLVAQLTEILDIDSLRERIVNMVTSELGLDATMLLLIEDPNAPPNSSPHLLVSVSPCSANRCNWRIQGENILYKVYLANKEIELHWAYHVIETPPEVRAWQQEQHITDMSFFPLSYQGRVLGTLGVARRETFNLAPRDTATITVFCEQISRMVEHAYLYHEAHERETFARAMVNIATRLNAAAIEPAEISQLICEEGAHALKADYVLLYTLNAREDQLVPLASYAGDQESVLKLSNWPPIQLHAYEAQPFHSLQPTILYTSSVFTSPTHTFPLALPAPQVARPASTLPTPSLLAKETFPAQIPTLRDKLARHLVHTAILAPLTSGGKPVGLLVFARTRLIHAPDKRDFDISDLPAAQEFVEQAGVAFTNAQLYQRLHTAHQRLQELDQLKDQFMITASHELRTPLTAVQGYIELMAQYGETLPPDQRQEFLQKAQRGCEELAVLLGNVMDASRLEIEAGIKPALLKRVSVPDMVENVIVLIEPHITQEQREIHLHIQQGLSVLADPVRLRQVLMNISVNALKYSPARTPLGFSASTDPAGPYAVISISDKGKGIKPQDQVHLFQRFVRLESDINSPIRGSGLGLYISRRLIEAMDGKIWIESRGIPGEGSTFHIQLPLA